MNETTSKFPFSQLFLFYILSLVLVGCSTMPTAKEPNQNQVVPFPEGLLYEVIDGQSITITKYIGNDTSVKIPASIEGLPVTVIGRMTFWGNKILKSVSIPLSVTSIKENVFGMCLSLTNINVEQQNSTYVSVDGVLFDKSGKTIICCPAGKSGEYSIPSSVIKIFDRAFWYCNNLTRITIPFSVTTIGDEAFGNCNSLTSVDIQGFLTYIGNNAFFSCNELLSVNIPTTVTYIGDSAFNGCKKIKSITIPSSVTTLGDSPFAWCVNLTNINVDLKNSKYTSIDGVVFDKSVKTIICYPSGKQGAYVIPSSVTTIGNSSFAGCQGLTSITIPQSVTIIEAWAFFDCQSLISFNIPSSVLTIKSYALANKNLKSVLLSRRTMVADDAFDEGVNIQYRD